MPLLDHFHPPLEDQYPWDSLHSNWATRIADAVNDLLPPGFLAAEHTHVGTHLEIDVASFALQPLRSDGQANGPATATLTAGTWAPPAPPYTMPAVFPDAFEVRVFATTGGRTLVGAIELISPANKDRASERLAFATKCASYLHQGVSLILIDIVTSRRANLHNDLMRLMQAAPSYQLSQEVTLYAVAYRPVLRGDRPEIDFWPATCAVGAPLPQLPLRLTGDLFVPVDFEASYLEACRRRRLV
jgi:hypothetical protein